MDRSFDDHSARSLRASRGFTLVELIVVVTVLGILAAVAAPRFFSRTPFEERLFAEDIAAQLRHARSLAWTTDCPVRASIDAAGYRLEQQRRLGNRCDPADGTWPTPVLGPEGAAVVGTTPAGVAGAPATVLVFMPNAGLLGGANVNFTVAGRNIQVDGATGTVRVL